MFDELEVKRLSEQYGLKCNIYPNSIFINAPYRNRNWICESHGDYYMLKHQNTKELKCRTHHHKDKYYSLEEVFRFITWHDNCKLLDKYRKRRLRFERLFNQM